MNQLPVIDCAGCGVCCTYMRTPPFIVNEIDRIPENLQREVLKAVYEPLTVRPDDSPCLWFDRITRQCKHYDLRPAICREFEVGGTDCLRVRAERSVINLARLRRAILQTSLRFGVEQDMQDDLEEVLRQHGIGYEREFRLGNGEIDFRVGRIGVECKVVGSPAEVLRQCRRYAGFDEIDALLLVTCKPKHRWDIEELGGKPFAVAWIAGRL